MYLVFSNKVINTWLDKQVDEIKQTITLTTEITGGYSLQCVMLSGIGDTQKPHLDR